MALTPNSAMSTQSINSFNGVLSAVSAWTPSATVITNAVLAKQANSNGGRITSLIIASTDTAAINMFLIRDEGGTGTNFSIIGQINIPITAGTIASTPCVDALSPSVCVGLPVDNLGKPFIHMGPSDKLYLGTVAAMAAAKIALFDGTLENY